jgi:hypothetical protein
LVRSNQSSLYPPMSSNAKLTGQPERSGGNKSEAFAVRLSVLLGALQ